jgi:4-amino-4-deoxy-L-arabinose transferase-like glycosyltransferase
MLRKRYEWLAAAVLIAAGAWLRLRIGYHWLFAGSDSYGYLKLADQLWQHARFALSPADPPHLGRMPLYPMFLAVVKRDHVAEMSGGDGWFLITNAQIYFELLTLPLVYLMARKLAGPIAAICALALAALVPFTPLYTSAVLTESLATSFTTITLAVLVLGQRRPMITFPAAGALIALSTLLRPDGILLAVAVLPAAWAVAADRKRRLTLIGASLLAFSVVFSPWVIRNLSAFGKPAVFGGRVDRFTRPMPDYHGWWRWITSWGRDESPQTFLSTCFYNPPCTIAPQMLPMEAFDTGDERATVDKLIGLRTLGGHNAQVSEGFETLGAARQWHHPLRSFIFLPLSRAWHMWISRYDEILQHPTLWPPIRAFGRQTFLPMTFVFSFALMFASAFLVWERRTRFWALVLALPILVRTVVLCFNNYSMPRYTVETWPIAFVLIAWAGVEVTRRLRARP